MSEWKKYKTKFQEISDREKYMIIFVGVFLIAFVFFNFFIDETYQALSKKEMQLQDTIKKNKSDKQLIIDLTAKLGASPDDYLKSQLAEYERQMSEADKELKNFTSSLVDPQGMREALIKLLKFHPGVTLKSFNIVAPELVINSEQKIDSTNERNSDGLRLYRHRIKIQLTGSYFQLKSYLKTMEDLSWRFVWSSFNLTKKQYPENELDLEIYSLSMERGFIGV